MMVRLMLFAGAKELAGTESMEVVLEDEATVGDLKQTLVEQHPSLLTLVEKSTFSVDQEYALDSKQLYHDAEVALIPPVSGG